MKTGVCASGKGEPGLDELAARLRRERAIGALMPLFFVSGATSLTYQTIWGRQLHLVFGTSTMAIATVLSAFMAGLAIGGFTMGRYADRIERPLFAYGILEAVIGVYALIFPFLLMLIEPIYLAAWRAFEPPLIVFAAIQFVLVAVCLVIPTALMGATLPLLARFATDRMGAAGDRVGRLYGINTFGAVAGTWLCGFMLLPSYGLFWTTAMAAAANVALGLAAIGVSEATRGAESAAITRDMPEAPWHPALVPVAIALALAGFSSLIYEVAWFRLLTLMLGPSTYAFSTMLIAFLVGIASGGTIGGRLADEALARYGQGGVLRLLGGLEVGIALGSFAMMYLFQELPFWYVWIYDWLEANRDVSMVWVISLILSVLVMMPPAVLMGAAFPVAVRAVIGDSEELGSPVGNVYGANTLGSVVGAALAGFILLPALGVQGTILVAGSANLLAAAICVGFSIQHDGKKVWGQLVLLPAALLVLLYFAARPPWDPLLMTAGMYHYVSSFKRHDRAGIISYAVESYELLYYREGPTSVVTVAKNVDSENIWLANNGKVDASSSSDMPTQVLCAVLPFMFVEEPEDVLVIGLASGVTAGSLVPIESMTSMQIVEIEPAIEEASEFFRPWNHDVLYDPRVKLIANDGRNQVLLSEPGSFDVIVSEPSNPWITGVSNLFTKEFLEMGKTRLKPGGVWSQWVQMYGMDEYDLKSLLQTFASVYPHVLVFSTIEDADLVLIGSEQPIRPDPVLAQRLMDSNPGLMHDLEIVNADEPLKIVSMFYMDRDEILELVGNIELNTDDNMRIEYNAPLHLHTSTADRNFEAMLPHAQVPVDVLGSHQEFRDLAFAYYERDHWARAVLALGYAAQRTPKGSDEWAVYREIALNWEASLNDDELPGDPEEIRERVLRELAAEREVEGDTGDVEDDTGDAEEPTTPPPSSGP